MNCFHTWRAVRVGMSLVVAAAVALLLWACTDSPLAPNGDPDPEETLPIGLVVSESQSASSAVTGMASFSAGSEVGPVAYVSVVPGTMPGAVSVRIRNVTTGGPSTSDIPVFDGGLDPVAVAANEGDQLELAVLEIGGSVSHIVVRVPSRRPPRVVRTNPPPGRTDVALSVKLEVVFSEPMDPASLEGGVRLLRGGSEVGGTVTLHAGSSFAVQFDPANPLQAESTYELVVTTAVRDRDGEAVQEEVRVGFTTAGSDATFNIVQVSAGQSHTCAVTTEGTAYCWGSNFSGELGVGGAVQSGVHWSSSTGTPKPVSGGLRFAEVSTGAGRTCGIAAGNVGYCWGRDEEAWYRDDVSDRPTPTPVAGGLRFAQMSTGRNMFSGFTSALSTEGVAYCWPSCSLEMPLTGAPQPVRIDLLFTRLGTGREHSCGITTEGAAYCWGANFFGNFGNGTRDSVAPSGPSAVAGDLRFKDVSAGVHTCGVTTNGDAYCWGINYAGELGDGTTELRLIPVPVSGGLSFAQVSAGFNHTCGVATDGVAYCWGLNDDGQLGDGTIDQRLVPTRVSGNLSFAQVSAGGSHTCGVTTEGVAYCWGRSYNGQLGYGTPTPGGPHASRRLTPTRVINP